MNNNKTKGGRRMMNMLDYYSPEELENVYPNCPKEPGQSCPNCRYWDISNPSGDYTGWCYGLDYLGDDFHPNN